MNCRDCDLLGALEGWDAASVDHVRSCPECARRAAELAEVVRLLDSAWQEGLVREVTALPFVVRPGEPPPGVARRLRRYREDRLVERMRERAGMDEPEARRIVRRMLEEQRQERPMAASPRRLLDPGEEEQGDGEDPR